MSDIKWKRGTLPSGEQTGVATVDGEVWVSGYGVLRPYLRGNAKTVGEYYARKLSAIRADFEAYVAREYADATKTGADGLRKAAADLAKLVELAKPKAPKAPPPAAAFRAAATGPVRGSAERGEEGRGQAHAAGAGRGAQGGEQGQQNGGRDAGV